MNINKLLQEANQLILSKKNQEAEIRYKEIIKLDTKNFIAYGNLGYLFLLKKSYKDSLTLLDGALKIKPDFTDALNNKGICLKALDRFEEALECYEKALKIKPDFTNALNNQGNCFQNLNRFEEALECYKKALSIKPNYIDALNNLGNCLKVLNRFEEAIESYKKALKIKPDFKDVLNNKGVCLKKLDRFEEALECYEKALKIKPDFFEALNNKGTCLTELYRYDEALSCFKKVLEIKPNFADTIWNISKIQLVNGNFNEGWKSYEWRKKTSSLGKNYKTYNKDINWLGDKDLNNKTILISYEQGLGDYLLYARYLPMIKKLGAKIILDTPKFIKPMIDSMNFDYTHTEELKKIDFDFHCSIASLPCAFKTSVETIPCKIPYLFTPKEKKEFWKKEFEDNSNIKIGLKWAGNKLHQDDRKRSMPLKKFKPLFDLPYDFHSLEIEYNKDDEKLLNEIPNLNCHKNQIPGLDNTAGLMESMDLVITVDTGINHLCGAIGKPFWILLSHVPDFRWFLDCNNSPWFPTAKLYRQTSRGDWDAVINRIKKDLLSLKNIRSN